MPTRTHAISDGEIAIVTLLCVQTLLMVSSLLVALSAARKAQTTLKQTAANFEGGAGAPTYR
jgi:hypothetical protein